MNETVDALDIYDKNRLPIAVGDILKVFHFIGARRKRHYMYKQVIGVRTFVTGCPYLVISHLNLAMDEPYHERIDGRVMMDCEIVQGMGVALSNRAKLAKSHGGGEHKEKPDG